MAGQPTPEGAAPEPTPPASPSADILAPSESNTALPPPSDRGPVLTEEEQIEAELEAMREMYRQLYRPSDNPGKFALLARGVFYVAGNSKRTSSGRLGGVLVDVGQNWNHIGYAASVHILGGQLALGENRQTAITSLIGGGPTVTMGRLALNGRGYFGLRLGYDFFYAPARMVPGAGPADPTNDLSVRAPHGPRLNINMGLLVKPRRDSKLFQGVGLSIGYQALVHSFAADMPLTHMLLFGLNYRIG